MVKNTNVITIEYCENKERNVLELTSFQGYHVETFAVGFPVFSVLQDVHLSREQPKFLGNDEY